MGQRGAQSCVACAPGAGRDDVRVAITGGTGSLGRALTRRLLPSSERVVIVSRDEVKQAEMAGEYGGDWVSHPTLRFFLGDVRDRQRMVDAFYGCEVVVHTAALKRVDATAYSPGELR